MDQSILYNLRNPGFVEDVGYSMINQMFPTMSNDTIVAQPQMLPNNTTMNPGQPQKDSYESPKVKKERNFIKAVLLLGAIALGGTYLYRKGSSVGTKLISGGKNLFNKIISKFKK